MGHPTWVRGTSGYMGASWGAQKGPHSGLAPGCGEALHCQATGRLLPARLQFLSPGSDQGSKQLFIQRGGPPVHKEAFITCPPPAAAQLCRVPSGAQGPTGKGRMRHTWVSANPGMAQRQGFWIIPRLAWRRAGAINLHSALSTSFRGPATLLFPEDPQTLPQGHQQSGAWMRAGGGKSRQVHGGWAGPGSAFKGSQPLLSGGRGWPGPRTAVPTRPMNSSTPKSVSLFTRAVKLNNQDKVGPKL